MRRRTFLRGALSAGAIGAVSPSLFGTRALADPVPWGELPDDPRYWPTSLPPPAYKILEIHLAGGLSAYETFHVDTSLSASDRWFGFLSQVSAVVWSGCGTDAPPTSTTTQPFDGNIELGPATSALWPLRDYMRVAVLHHDLEPHEAAIPYSLTGLPLGNPKFAGLGAAIEHRYDRSLSGKTTPHSYVLIPGNLSIDEDSFLGFHAIGMHGGAFRPLALRIPNVAGRDTAFLQALQRTGIETRQNDLLRNYLSQYRNQLRHRTTPGSSARSSEFVAYTSAAATLFDAPTLHTVLDGAIASTIADASCVDGGSALNLTRSALETATRLLTLAQSDGGARYVGLVDGGIRDTTGGGYDVHGSGEYPNMFINLWNCLSNLARLVHRPATPAAVDPNRINLNDTLVILNTEFGREPNPGPRGGRDHWPAGYVNVLLGGPITSSGVAGAFLSDGSADQTVSFTAADVRAAALIAAGVDPFAAETYGVGDVSQTVRSAGGGTEEGCAEVLRREMLGVT